MIIDLDMLVRLVPVKIQRDEFAARFPQKWTGRLGLWGTAEERSTTWRILLADEFSDATPAGPLLMAWCQHELQPTCGRQPDRRHPVGAEVGANLTCANLTDADLTDANLGRQPDRTTRPGAPT